MTDHYAEMLAHLVRMARIPGFRAHAWHRAQELAKTELYSGMDAALIAAMKHEKQDDPPSGN